MKPMFLDGPWRGREVEIDGLPFMVPVFKETAFIDLWMENLTLAQEPLFDEVVYYKHQLKFGSHCLIVASINPAQPNMDDAFELMLNDYAKRSEQL